MLKENEALFVSLELAYLEKDKLQDYMITKDEEFGYELYYKDKSNLVAIENDILELVEITNDSVIVKADDFGTFKMSFDDFKIIFGIDVLKDDESMNVARQEIENKSNIDYDDFITEMVDNMNFVFDGDLNLEQIICFAQETLARILKIESKVIKITFSGEKPTLYLDAINSEYARYWKVNINKIFTKNGVYCTTLTLDYDYYLSVVSSKPLK